MSFYLLFALILGIVRLPLPPVDADALGEFTRLGGHLDHKLYVVDHEGREMMGRLAAMDSSSLSLDLGRHLERIPVAEVLRVDREGDPVWDGIAKGAVIGALLAAITTRDAEFTLRGAVIYGGVGFLFDYGHRARSPVYRAPAPTTVAWTVKWE